MTLIISESLWARPLLRYEYGRSLRPLCLFLPDFLIEGVELSLLLPDVPHALQDLGQVPRMSQQLVATEIFGFL
jgi:hypothetical protein